MADTTRATETAIARTQERHSALVDAYLETGSITQAAEQAGYSRGYASTLLNSPPFLAQLEAAKREAGITPMRLATVLDDALGAERVLLAPDGTGGVREVTAPDHKVRLTAYSLVVKPLERQAEAHAQAQARAEHHDLDALARLTDDELLDALARRGRRQQPPIEATATRVD